MNWKALSYFAVDSFPISQPAVLTAGPAWRRQRSAARARGLRRRPARRSWWRRRAVRRASHVSPRKPRSPAAGPAATAPHDRRRLTHVYKRLSAGTRWSDAQVEQYCSGSSTEWVTTRLERVVEGMNRRNSLATYQMLEMSIEVWGLKKSSKQ